MAFNGFLRQSTAVDILIGPFVDEDDGKTAEPGLTISQADVTISKNGQTLAQKNDVTACAADGSNGYYNCELDATDTNTVGQLVVTIHESGALPCRHEYHVVEEAVYDLMYAGSAVGPASSAVATEARLAELDAANLPSDVDDILADTGELQTNQGNWLTATSVTVSDKTGFSLVSTGLDEVIAWTTDITGTVSGNSTHDAAAVKTAIEAGGSSLAQILTDTGTTLPAQLDSISGATFNTATDSLEALRNRGDAEWTTATSVTVSDKAGFSLVSTGLDAVIAWTTDITGTVSGNSTHDAAAVKTAIEAGGSSIALILADTGTTIPAQLDSMSGATFNTSTDSLEAIRDRGDADWSGGGSAPTVAQIRTEMDDNSTKLAAIVEDTGTTIPAAITVVDGEVGQILTDTGTTIPATLGTPADTDLATDLTNITTDTEDIQSRLPAALITGRMASDVEAINDDTDAADNLAASALGVISCAVDTVTNTHTPTTSVFQSDSITEETADHYNGRIIIFTSGPCAGQATDITDYEAVGGIGQFTVTAMTTAPLNNNNFVIV